MLFDTLGYYVVRGEISKNKNLLKYTSCVVQLKKIHLCIYIPCPVVFQNQIPTSESD